MYGRMRSMQLTKPAAYVLVPARRARLTLRTPTLPLPLGTIRTGRVIDNMCCLLPVSSNGLHPHQLSQSNPKVRLLTGIGALEMVTSTVDVFRVCLRVPFVLVPTTDPSSTAISSSPPVVLPVSGRTDSVFAFSRSSNLRAHSSYIFPASRTATNFAPKVILSMIPRS